jgi:mevalonate kinase
LEAGALGAKISGSGGGGIVIALVAPQDADAVAAAIQEAGGCASRVTTGTGGVRLEDAGVWGSVCS